MSNKFYQTTVTFKRKKGEDIYGDVETGTFSGILSTTQKFVIVTDGVAVYQIPLKEDQTVREALETNIRNKHQVDIELISLATVENTATPEMLKKLDAMETAKKTANTQLKKMEKYETSFNNAQDKFSLLFRTAEQKKNLKASEKALKEYYAKLEENNRIALKVAADAKFEGDQ